MNSEDHDDHFDIHKGYIEYFIQKSAVFSPYDMSHMIWVINYKLYYKLVTHVTNELCLISNTDVPVWNKCFFLSIDSNDLSLSIWIIFKKI